MKSIVPILGFPTVETSPELFLHVSTSLKELGHMPDLLMDRTAYFRDKYVAEVQYVPFLITCTDRFPEGIEQALTADPFSKMSPHFKNRLLKVPVLELKCDSIAPTLNANRRKYSLWKHEQASEQMKISAEYILRHIHNEKLSVRNIAEHLGVPLIVLEAVFLQCAETTVWQYVINTRMRVAKNLLDSTNLTINQTAIAVGYLDQSNFTRAFRRRFGRSPMVYRSASNRERIYGE